MFYDGTRCLICLHTIPHFFFLFLSVHFFLKQKIKTNESELLDEMWSGRPRWCETFDYFLPLFFLLLLFTWWIIVSGNSTFPPRYTQENFGAGRTDRFVSDLDEKYIKCQSVYSEIQNNYLGLRTAMSCEIGLAAAMFCPANFTLN